MNIHKNPPSSAMENTKRLFFYKINPYRNTPNMSNTVQQKWWVYLHSFDTIFGITPSKARKFPDFH